MMNHFSHKAILFIFFVLTFSVLTNAQNLEREFSLTTGGLIDIKNPQGRIDVKAVNESKNSVILKVESSGKLLSDDFRIDSTNKKIKIEIKPLLKDTRIDVEVQIPIRSKVKLETNDGQITIAGDLALAEAKSNTGTIYADVPIANIQYKFIWSGSRPRFVSDVELEDYKEKSAGKFVIQGKIKNKVDSTSADTEITEIANENQSKVQKKSQSLSVNFRTVRGIILLNVPPNEVPSDLTERPLTNAAKAIIKSGDSLLTAAIRRASPKYFGDYAATLPPRKKTPFLKTAKIKKKSLNSKVKKVNVQVVDINNRAVSGLKENDFTLSERGDIREVLSVEQTNSPFNLVLLLDVSGSV